MSQSREIALSDEPLLQRVQRKAVTAGRLPEDHVPVQSAPATVLAALLAAPFDESSEEFGEVAQDIAEAAGASIDVRRPGSVLLSFARAELALEAARQLQEFHWGRRLHIGLATGVCNIAQVRIDGRVQSSFVGDTVEMAHSMSTMAPAGSIRLSPDLTVDLLGQIETWVDRLVTTEFDDDGVATVSLALPPQRGDALSTFAGLGLI